MNATARGIMALVMITWSVLFGVVAYGVGWNPLESISPAKATVLWAAPFGAFLVIGILVYYDPFGRVVVYIAAVLQTILLLSGLTEEKGAQLFFMGVNFPLIIAYEVIKATTVPKSEKTGACIKCGRSLTIFNRALGRHNLCGKCYDLELKAIEKQDKN